MFLSDLDKINELANHAANYLMSRYHYRRLVAALENHEAFGTYPLNIQVQTTSACNASCYFCPYEESWHKSHAGRMRDEVYRTIIDALSSYRISRFCPYLENEPLLDPRIFDRIEYAMSRLNLTMVEISTNASVLDKQRIDDIEHLLSSSRHEIWISFHGISKETFNAATGLDFDSCMNHVMSLIERAQHSDLKVIIRGAGFARMKRDEMPFWFDRKQFYDFWGRTFKKHGFKKRPKLRFFTYHDRAGQIRRNEVNFSEIIRSNLTGFYCPRVNRWLHFLYNGELILCCMDYSRETVFGDITKKSLKEIRQSDIFLTLARQTLGMIRSADDFICKKCVSPGG